MRASRVLSRPWSIALAMSLAAWLGACTDIQFRDRPPFNPPADAASGFLGYFTVDSQQTTCGNCHVGQQADWIQTKHASAWADLQNTGFAQPFCSTCHTVTSRGNQPFAHVGYDSVASASYQDVQCESCHGPGLLHVQNPSVVANRPIPSINIDTAAAITNSSCGGCHTDDSPAKHHNYLTEWLSSRHGQLRQAEAVQASCQPCHEGKGALRAWYGSQGQVFKEVNDPNVLLPQNCVVCHDPHGSAKDAATGLPLPGQLRFPLDSPDEQTNLCTHCHGRVDRSTPTPTNARGPHGVQGPVVFGVAGYFPPGSSYDTTTFVSTHSSTANPRLCAGCHVNKLTGVDTAGNSITFSGHSFHPLPCLMQKSPAVVDTTFTNNCAFDAPSRSWGACTASGCHASEAVAVQIFTNLRSEIDGYARTLWINSTPCAVVPPATECTEGVDAFPADSGYLAKIMAAFPGDLDYTGVNKNLMTAAKGAVFNVQIAGEGYASHPDASKGVHNPFLYRAILQASIADLLATYGGILPAPPAPVLAEIQAAIRSGHLRLAPATEAAIMNPNQVRTTVRSAARSTN
jgi:Cytochrome c554 and c-prime/Doubled CXXCH motif (Paired_CXXCH_1)